MIFRIFIIGVALALIWWAIRVLLTPRLPRAPKANKKAPQEKMIQCAHCGLHVPESEAIVSGEKSYCSLEHQKADQGDS